MHRFYIIWRNCIMLHCIGDFERISDHAVNIMESAQELYEKKMTTYPRTDARVLSTAVSKEIYKNIKGLTNFQLVSSLASRVLQEGTYKGIAKTR